MRIDRKGSKGKIIAGTYRKGLQTGENAKKKSPVVERLWINKYKEGDVVWYLQLKRKTALCPKLTLPYTELFLIKIKVSDQNLIVQFSDDGMDKLKPFKSMGLPKWILREKRPSAVFQPVFM